MLTWIKENGKHLGFDDGDFLYRVFETPEGWMWETSDAWEGECDFETAEQAMIAAQLDWNKKLEQLDKIDLIDLEMSLQDLEEILGDILFEEYREAGLLN